MKIRKATLDDFNELYNIGKHTPELKVSNGVFMEPKEFRWSIENPNGIFLLAEDKRKIVGFVYANAQDSTRPVPRGACLVYIAVVPEFRRKGVATRLYEKCIEELKKIGIRYVYCIANAEMHSGIIEFMKKQGLEVGHKFVWMDGKL